MNYALLKLDCIKHVNHTKFVPALYNKILYCYAVILTLLTNLWQGGGGGIIITTFSSILFTHLQSFSYVGYVRIELQNRKKKIN